MDTLKYYDSLIATGEPDEKARAHVAALQGATTEMVTKDYLRRELMQIKLLGWAMFVVIVSPSLQQFLELFK